MKTYNVYVQEKFYKTVSNDDVGSIIAEIAKDIKEDKVPGFDTKKDQNIKIEPVS